MECGEGVMIYIAFLKDTTNEEIDCLVNKIYSNPLFRTLRKSIKKHENEKGNDQREETNILIVPQFSLGGKMKSGKSGAQYHQSCKPQIAEGLYQQCCHKLKEKNENTDKKKNLDVKIHCGIFGNRQGLKVETHGPFTHCFDINIENKQNKKSNHNNNKTGNNKKNKQSKKKQLLMNNNQNKHRDVLQCSNANVSDKIDDIINLVERL